MFIYGPFPNIEMEISSRYQLIVADTNTITDQRKYSYLIMLFIYLFACFGLGCSMYSFSTLFIHSAFWFLGYLILMSFIIIPLHYFIHCLFYPVKMKSEECFIGFYKKLLTPFCYCKKELRRQRLIISSLVPFVLLTIIPLVVFMNLDTNMCLYAFVCVNALLSSFDIYDAYVLIRKIPKGDNFIIKSNNTYYTILDTLNIVDTLDVVDTLEVVDTLDVLDILDSIETLDVKQ